MPRPHPDRLRDRIRGDYALLNDADRLSLLAGLLAGEIERFDDDGYRDAAYAAYCRMLAAITEGIGEEAEALREILSNGRR